MISLLLEGGVGREGVLKKLVPATRRALYSIFQCSHGHMVTRSRRQQTQLMLVTFTAEHPKRQPNSEYMELLYYCCCTDTRVTHELTSTELYLGSLRRCGAGRDLMSLQVQVQIMSEYNHITATAVA